MTTIQETLTAPPILSIATSVIEETVSFPFLSTIERTIVQSSVSFVYSSLNSVVVETPTESAQQAAPTATETSVSVLYSLREDTITRSFFLTETAVKTPLPQIIATTVVFTASLPAEINASLANPTAQVITSTAIATVTASSESSPNPSTSCPDPCAVNIFATELIYPTRVETLTKTVTTATLDTWITVLPDGSESTSISTRTVLTLDPSSLASIGPQLTWTDDSFPGVILTHPTTYLAYTRFSHQFIIPQSVTTVCAYSTETLSLPTPTEWSSLIYPESETPGPLLPPTSLIDYLERQSTVREQLGVSQIASSCDPSNGAIATAETPTAGDAVLQTTTAGAIDARGVVRRQSPTAIPIQGSTTSLAEPAPVTPSDAGMNVGGNIGNLFPTLSAQPSSPPSPSSAPSSPIEEPIASQTSRVESNFMPVTSVPEPVPSSPSSTPSSPPKLPRSSLSPSTSAFVPSSSQSPVSSLATSAIIPITVTSSAGTASDSVQPSSPTFEASASSTGSASSDNSPAQSQSMLPAFNSSVIASSNTVESASLTSVAPASSTDLTPTEVAPSSPSTLFLTLSPVPTPSTSSWRSSSLPSSLSSALVSPEPASTNAARAVGARGIPEAVIGVAFVVLQGL
ncbi:hypothetical protein LTS18_014483 [Coniosporium uncinatum]|uniref:Uncharacterized protein n=1 Tax=Coniosporium uncinatum TaxID=93489 RepID=A0ACC3DCB8_9PEZI|nr:hypothetical protein LTS18_014483 [Coniosporium uncinatum]